MSKASELQHRIEAPKCRFTFVALRKNLLSNGLRYSMTLLHPRSGTRSGFSSNSFREATSPKATCLAALFRARVQFTLRQAKLAVCGRWLCDTSTLEIWTQHQLRGFVKVHWITQASQINLLKPESKSETSLLVNLISLVSTLATHYGIRGAASKSPAEKTTPRPTSGRGTGRGTNYPKIRHARRKMITEGEVRLNICGRVCN